MVEEACPRARALGVRPGFSLGQAYAVAPGLQALPYQPERDRAELDRLVRWAGRFSPRVEALPPKTLLIDITGCQRLFGGEGRILHQAALELARLGFRARGSIADTVGGAYALAVAGSEPLQILPVGRTSAYLAPLPPIALRIRPDAADRLDALGVRTIGHLLALPRAALPARFGSQVVLRLQQALGEAYEGVSTHCPVEAAWARRAFEEPVTDAEVIRRAAEELLRRVLLRLEQRCLALRRLECILYYEHGPPRVVSVSLVRPLRDAGHIAGLLREKLQQLDLRNARGSEEGLAGEMGAAADMPAVEMRTAEMPVEGGGSQRRVTPRPGTRGLMVLVRETQRWDSIQNDLFEPRDPAQEEALGCLVDRLAGRVGHEAIVRPALVEDHQPERAFRYRPVAEVGCEGPGGQGVKGSRGPGAEGSRGLGAKRPRGPGAGGSGGEGVQERTGSRPRPVRVFRRPVPIRVIALVPDGPPTWFYYASQEHIVVHAEGPERIETGWWRGPDVRRDYFRVLTDRGEQFWIFHAQEEHGWYVHGVFA